MNVRATWTGVAATQSIKRAYGRGIIDAAEHLLGETNKIAPLDEGILIGSGSVDSETKTDGDTSATVSYDTKYAAKLHEHPESDIGKDASGKELEITGIG